MTKSKERTSAENTARRTSSRLNSARSNQRSSSPSARKMKDKESNINITWKSGGTKEEEEEEPTRLYTKSPVALGQNGDVLHPSELRPFIVEDSFIDFAYRPHTITWLMLLIAIIVYKAFTTEGS
jgi:hypothetical protein